VEKLSDAPQFAGVRARKFGRRIGDCFGVIASFRRIFSFSTIDANGGDEGGA